jgi:hypothetical protein
MKTINNNTSLTNFNFWSGAKQHEFTYNELNEIENVLEDIYPEGMEETQINDLFWFEEEIICEWIGINYNEYLNR